MISTKRQNFNISAEQEAEISQLKELINAPTTKDAILAAVKIVMVIAQEIKEGKQIFVTQEQSGPFCRLIIPEIESIRTSKYKYLVERPHPWKQQLFLKGRRLPAATVINDMVTNEMTPQKAAKSWNIPLEAVYECMQYVESHQALLDMEEEEESRQLAQKGIEIESTSVA